MSNVTLSSSSYKLRNKLYLNEHEISISESAPVVKQPINHVFCCDVSGSMSNSLAKMRQQLKNNLSTIVAPEDTITIIAFSSPTVCYVLKEVAKVNNPKQLSDLQQAIDRYLVPNGWTDFVPPIKATEKLINNYEGNWNWIFLSDGGHNEGPFQDVINALSLIQNKLSGATIIEYGYYADSARLSQMAELLGGTKIAAEDFDAYVPVFESALNEGNCTSKVTVDLSSFVGKLVGRQVIYLNPSSHSIHVVNPTEGGSVEIPSYVTKLITISNSVIGKNVTPDALASDEDHRTSAYAAAYVMLDLLKYSIVEDLLVVARDLKLFNKSQVAYGKQKMFELSSDLLKFTFDTEARSLDNCWDAALINTDPYSVVDLVNDLKSGNNFIKVVNPDFRYNRIGAKATNKVMLTSEDKQALDAAKSKRDVEKVLKGVAEHEVKMQMIDKPYPISDFTWNEERANLSALMKIDVELTLPKNDVGLTKVDSFIFRNYTIIKDGVLNINSLPVVLDKATFDKVTYHKIPFSNSLKIDEEYHCTLDISALPIINKRHVHTVKMKTMTKLAYQLMDYKFQLKYLGYLKKSCNLVTDSVATSRSKYTAAQYAYLESLGITDKGYSPKVELNKSEDYYMALTLNSNFKGFSSVPAIEAIDKKLKAGKSLTPSEEYLQDTIKFIDAKYLSNVKGDAYKRALDAAFNMISTKKVTTADKLAQMKFAMVLSHKWFIDCLTMDENTDSITTDYGTTLTIEYRFAEKKQSL